MVFTTFRVYKRFQILFVHIFVSLDFPSSPLNGDFPSSPLNGAFCFTYINSANRNLMFLILHNCLLWAFFFFSIWVGFLVFLREEPSETKICTKRIRNFHKPGKLWRPLFIIQNINNLATKNIVNLPASFFCFSSCVRKIHNSNPVKIFSGTRESWFILC